MKVYLSYIMTEDELGPHCWHFSEAYGASSNTNKINKIGINQPA